MVPGVHYKEFEVWGTVLPAEADITCVCGHCMPLGRQVAEDAQALEAEASSSSSGEDGPGPKKARVSVSSSDDDVDAEP